jgi:hypothetical protein
MVRDVALMSILSACAIQEQVGWVHLAARNDILGLQ